MYKIGKGVAQNHQLAFKYFEKAAKSGHTNSMVELGVCYEYGNGVIKNYTEAGNWYKKAAEAGNCYGQVNYAYYNYNIKMYHTALLWIEKAIANGFKDEKNTLAIIRKAAQR